MTQISMPFEEKIDGPLARLCNGTDGISPSARFPVLVRCQREALAEVSAHIKRVGGTIRHELRMLSALAAWIPLSEIEPLARDGHVCHIELEQEFSLA